MVNILPLDVWKLICNLITFDDVRSLSCTCKYLSELTRETYTGNLVIDLSNTNRKYSTSGNFSLGHRVQTLYTIEYNSTTRCCLHTSKTFRSVQIYNFETHQFETSFDMSYSAFNHIWILYDVLSQWKHQNCIVLRVEIIPYDQTRDDVGKAEKRKMLLRDKALDAFKTEQSRYGNRRY